jgi:hypothetical protein
VKLPRQGKLFETIHIKFVGKGKGFHSYSSVKNDAEFIWGVEQCRRKLPWVPWATGYGPKLQDTIGSLQ